MMIVRNLKTRKEFEITALDWEKIRGMGLQNSYKVIDYSNTTPIKQKVSKINVPSIITEFQAKVKKNTKTKK